MTVPIALINGRNTWLISTGEFSRGEREREFPYVHESNFPGGLLSRGFRAKAFSLRDSVVRCTCDVTFRKSSKTHFVNAYLLKDKTKQ